MPPKAIVNKEDILNAALKIVRERGMENVNARSLAKELNCSTRPLFRIYKNMEDLKKDLFAYADNYLGDYLVNFKSNYDNPLINIGLAYIEFAQKERNVFHLIYLSNNFSYSDFRAFIFDGKGKDIFSYISNQGTADLNHTELENLYFQTLIYSHGLATLVATNDIEFPHEVLVNLLINAYISFQANIKSLDMTGAE